MTREIKFRAWDKAVKMMLVGDTWYNKELTILQDIEDLYIDKERYELMQYTGLRDKNDTEIYEGDILKSTANGANCLDIFQVVWLESRASFRLKHIYVLNQDDSATFGMTTVKDSFEIIGNIYQNPELLTN